MPIQYYQSTVELYEPDAKKVPVVFHGGKPVRMDIDEVIDAASDYVFRRNIQCIEIVKKRLEAALFEFNTKIKIHTELYALKLDPSIAIRKLDYHIENTCNRFFGATDEGVKNALWHANLGDPRKPILLSVGITGNGNHRDDYGEVRISDTGPGFNLDTVNNVFVENLENNREGGLGVTGYMQRLEHVQNTDRSLIPPGPYTHTITMTHRLFRDLFDGRNEQSGT